MGWLRLDDHYDDHPKIVAAGSEAAWLDIRGMLFCARHETDGVIPSSQLSRIGSDYAPAKRARLIGQLVDAGRWTKTDDGYIVNDFLDYNPSSITKQTEREAARERMKKAREKKRSRSGEQPSEQPAKFSEDSDNPGPAPALESPLPPAKRGDQKASPRSNGTSPRQNDWRGRISNLEEAIEGCADCSDKPWTCPRCAERQKNIDHLKEKISNLGAVSA